MLSNTATPYYYGLFRDSVLRGAIPVCKEVSMQMNLIDEMICNPEFYYDDKAIDGFIKFCENELTLTDGGDLKLTDCFKLWAEDLLAWFYFEDEIQYNPHTRKKNVVKKKKRLRNKQMIISARGSAKSIYTYILQSYIVVIDAKTTHGVVTAPTIKQAEETIGPMRTSIARARGPLYKFLTEGSIQNTTGNRQNRPKLAATKLGIQNFLTSSIVEVRAMSINKLQGLRNYITTIDEWLSGDTKEDIIGAIEQGASKLDDYIIVGVSSEGTSRNGVGDSIKMELHSILRGEYYAPHVSVWHYKLDSIEEVNMPEMWIKANSNIGITVPYSAYHKDIARMEVNPTTRNDILAKRFGIPMAGLTYFFTYEETLLHRVINYNGMVGALGADMSQGDDFCAFNMLFPLSRGRFGTVGRSYVSKVKMDKLPSAYYQKYLEFIEEGSLVVMEGAVLNMIDVYEDVTAWIDEHDYTVIAFGYDPYNADQFVKRWISENGEYGVEKVIQGARTESVPMGEMKKLSEERMLIFHQAIMQFSMGNAVAEEDNNHNYKLSKKRYAEKIDNVAALLDAWIAYRRNQEAF